MDNTTKKPTARRQRTLDSSNAPAAKSRRLSPTHKEAIAVGRVEALVVQRYLESLAENRPRPGRPRGLGHEQRLAEVEGQLAASAGIEKLRLVQERLDLQAALSAANPQSQAKAEDEFVAVAAAFSLRRGISRAAWRELGVPVSVLRRANIVR